MGTDQDFSQREFGLALWYVRHRASLRKIFIASLVVFDVVLIGSSLLGLGRFIISGRSEEANVASLVSTPTFHSTVLATRLPRELTLESVKAVTSGTRTDLVALIENPNEHWGARLTGHFRVNGLARSTFETVIAPKGDGIFVEFGVPGIGGAADLVVDKVEWVPVRSNRPLAPISFPVKSISLDVDERGTTRVRAEITNASPVGFREASFVLLGFAGERVVAINRLTRENFKAGETTILTAAWTSPISTPSNFRLIPTIDIFNPQVYLPLIEAKIEEGG